MKRKINFKTVTAILAVALILFATYSIFQTGDYWTKKKAFEKDKEKLQTQIDDWKKEADLYFDYAHKFKTNADAEAARRKELERELRETEKERKRLKSKVAKMKADEVISETVRVLAIEFSITNDHIWKNVDGVQFTLRAARANLTTLMEWEYYKYESVPKYKKLIVSAASEIKDLRVSIYWYDQALKAGIETVQLLEEQNKATENILAECEKTLRRQKFKLFGFSAGTAIVVGGLILLLK